MAQVASSKPEIVTPKGLGPGFWPLTIVTTIVNVAVGFWLAYGNIDFMLPAASNPASDSAVSVDWLFRFMLIFGAAITIYVNVYVIYFAIVFRRRRGEALTTVGVPIHDAPKLELWWTVLPTILLVVLMYFTIVVWKQIQFPVNAANLTMEVVAHQFNFEFRYPGLKSSLFSPDKAMHLPIGKSVKILVSSGDVIHQFWVPEYRLKIAAVPGLVTDLNLTPTRAGTFDIACSEYCGANHSVMQAKLVVEPPAEFEKWIAERRAEAAKAAPAVALTGGDAAAGQKTFDQKCSACHAAAPFDQKKVGPGLAKLTDDSAHPKLVDDDAPTPENIAKILDKGFTGPLGVMPSRQANGLTDADIANLVAYLVSLK